MLILIVISFITILSFLWTLGYIFTELLSNIGIHFKGCWWAYFPEWFEELGYILSWH